MATYNELHALRGSAGIESLKQKIEVAIAIKANTLTKLPAPTTAQKDFAKAALTSPASYLEVILNYILADYNTVTTSVISSAVDADVQTAVNAAVDTLLAI